jgi:hypothetical protein
MSNKSYRDGQKSLILMVEPNKCDLEAVLSFEKFPDMKTSANIATWLRKGHLRGGLKPEYILCHATDGASNAVGSALEFAAITRESRETDIRTYVCLAHQVNRSAKWASGTGDFRVNLNQELSTVLKKLHEINARVYRNEGRLKILFKVQKDKKRSVFSCVLFFILLSF